MNNLTERDYKLILETLDLGKNFLCDIKRERLKKIVSGFKDEMYLKMSAEKALAEIIKISPTDSNLYLDFNSVKASLLLHRKKFGKTTLANVTEDAYFKELKWKCNDTGKIWKIKVSDYLSWVNSRPGHEQDAFEKVLHSKQGLDNLASILSTPPVLSDIKINEGV